MNFLIGKHADKGIKKEVNQDSMLIKIVKSPYGRIGLFAIADGMGGLASGELASSTLITSISDWFEESKTNLNFSESNEENILMSIKDRIVDVNNRIVDYGKNRNEMLGTTLTLMLTVDTKYYLAHVGDSRAYKLNNTLELLTEDHTFVAREVSLGNITKEEAKVHKRRNVLLQCIGAKDGVTPQLASGKLEENTIYIICSDGQYKKLNDDEFMKELQPWKYTNSTQLEEKANELVNRVMSRRETDNISTIIMKTIN